MNLCSEVGRSAVSGLIVRMCRFSYSFLQVQQTHAKVGMCNSAVSRDEMKERWTKRAAGKERARGRERKRAVKREGTEEKEERG